MPSKLSDLGPVCYTNITDNCHWRTPTPELFSNIPLLWEILEVVVKDWQREVTPLQANIDNASDENKRLYYTLQAFQTLQPHYFKSLFSYVMFFRALENAYDRFYKQLNTLNRKPFFRVKHNTPPKETAYINKVKRIRNLSIAHILSQKARPVNSAAAAMWQPMTLSSKIGEVCDLNKMTFEAMKLTLRNEDGTVIDQADDFEIKGISELDKFCKGYLDEYDRICADYLYEIQTMLPITVGNEQYFRFIGSGWGQ